MKPKIATKQKAQATSSVPLSAHSPVKLPAISATNGTCSVNSIW